VAASSTTTTGVGDARGRRDLDDRAASARRGGGEVIALLDDDDDDDDDDVVVVVPQGRTTAASSSSTTSARRRTSSAIVVDERGKKGPPSLPPFVPFHLYETTTARSSAYRNNRNDAATSATARYFRTLRQMVGIDDDRGKRRNGRRRYHWLFVFNFLVDITYLIESLSPEIFAFRRVVVFYGNCGGDDDDDTGMELWRRALRGSGNTVEFVRVVPTDPPRSRTNPLSTKMRYGCHHTKMFLLGYDDNNKEDESDHRLVLFGREKSLEK